MAVKTEIVVSVCISLVVSGAELLLAYCWLFIHLCYLKCAFEPSAQMLIVVCFPMDLGKVCPHIF